MNNRTQGRAANSKAVNHPPKMAAMTAWGVAKEDKNMVAFLLIDENKVAYAVAQGTRENWEATFRRYRDLCEKNPLPPKIILAS
jgi:hypothetical protein